jgi:uncharacterized protein (DUF1330 family)
MPSYVIFLREGEIVDPEAMAAYQNGNRSGPPADVKPLVVYGALEALEGDAPDGVVILQFPDKDAAKAWYHGDYYERAKLRQKAAPYRGFIVEGL